MGYRAETSALSTVTIRSISAVLSRDGCVIVTRPSHETAAKGEAEKGASRLADVLFSNGEELEFKCCDDSTIIRYAVPATVASHPNPERDNE